MNHYKYLEEAFLPFYNRVCSAEGIEPSPIINNGIIVAHGDKCYQYKDRWEIAGIPFNHGAACYLLTYINPWANEVRDVAGIWINPSEWVVANYKDRLSRHLVTGR